MSSHALIPAITKPTRLQTCLDHIFIKANSESIGIISKCSITDHDIAIAAISSKHRRRHDSTSWYHKTDYDAVVAELQKTTWCSVFNQRCVDSATNHFMSVLSKTIQDHTQRIKTSRSKYSIKPWITPGLIKCMRHRDKLHLAARAHPNDGLRHTLFIKYRNTCNRLLQNLKTEYHKAKIQKHQNDPKQLWKVLKNMYDPNHYNNNSTKLLLSGQSPENSVN